VQLEEERFDTLFFPPIFIPHSPHQTFSVVELRSVPSNLFKMSHTQEVHQPEMQHHQPGSSPAMTTKKTEESIPKVYLTSAAKEAGKQTVDQLEKSQDVQQAANNLEQNASQKLDDAKAKAQGMWAKWCGCLGSV